MNRSAALIPMLAAAALIAACAAEEPEAASASAQARGQSDCFYANNVDGFTPRGEEAVDIRVGPNRHYRLELGGFCPDVDWSQQIALRNRGGSSWICRGMDAEIIVPTPGIGPQRCLVTDVRRLTEAEVEAARR